MKNLAKREAVAIFHNEGALRAALAALSGVGFGPARISLLASCETVEAKLGHRFRKIAELADNAGTPRVAYAPVEEAAGVDNAMIGGLAYVAASFGLILASSGGLVPMILAATAAGGAVATVGEVLRWLVGHEHARTYEEQIKCGGLLLWVRVDNEREAERAVEILHRHTGGDVHLHPLPQVTSQT